jgi:hypothetical protein
LLAVQQLLDLGLLAAPSLRALLLLLEKMMVVFLLALALGQMGAAPVPGLLAGQQLLLLLGSLLLAKVMLMRLLVVVLEKDRNLPAVQ